MFKVNIKGSMINGAVLFHRRYTSFQQTLSAQTQSDLSNMIKVYNEDTRTKSMLFSRCLYCQLLTCFTSWSCVSIVDCDDAFVCWA